jgi:hypothetical protein
VGINIDGERGNILADLEQKGLTTLHMSGGELGVIEQAIPETLGMSSAQLLEMPPYVRNFKCEGKLEDGEPLCSKEKFTEGCANRGKQTSWHPGWKWHALVGNGMALSLMERLGDALTNLVQLEKYDPLTLFNELKAQEDKDYATFFGSEINPLYKSMLQSDSSAEIDEIVKMTFQERGVCRTARLPSESRFKGIMTSSKNRFGHIHYERGIVINWGKEVPDSNEMTLAFDPGGELRGCRVCAKFALSSSTASELLEN